MIYQTNILEKLTEFLLITEDDTDSEHAMINKASYRFTKFIKESKRNLVYQYCDEDENGYTTVADTTNIAGMCDII